MYDTSDETKKDSVADELEEAKLEAMLFTGIAATSTIFIVSFFNYYI